MNQEPSPKKFERPKHSIKFKTPSTAKSAHRWYDGPLARNPPRRSYLRPCKTPYIQLETTWDETSILSARDAHLLGKFQQSGLLWVWMLCTSRLKITIRKRVGALSGLLTVVEPASGEKTGTPIEKAVAKLWEAQWLDIMPESLRQGIQRQAIGLGVSLCRVHWVEDEVGRWWPRLTLWPDDAFYYNDEEQCFYARTREGADKKVKPACGWFLYLPDGMKGFQLGAVVSLAIDCLLASMAKSDWANYNQATATVVKKAIVPRGAVESVKNAFLDNVEEVGTGENTTVLCPTNQDGSKFDFEYESAGEGAKVDTFERSKSDAEKTITIEILGQEKTTDDGGVGTYDAVESLQGVEDRIILNDGETLSTAIHYQLQIPWACHNFGHGEWAPWVRWKPKKNNAAKAKAGKELADSVAAIDQALAKTDREVDKVRVFEEEDFPLMKRPVVVPPLPGREPMLPT